MLHEVVVPDGVLRGAALGRDEDHPVAVGHVHERDGDRPAALGAGHRHEADLVSLERVEVTPPDQAVQEDVCLGHGFENPPRRRGAFAFD